jgi:hypothetical protein
MKPHRPPAGHDGRPHPLPPVTLAEQMPGTAPVSISIRVPAVPRHAPRHSAGPGRMPSHGGDPWLS